MTDKLSLNENEVIRVHVMKNANNGYDAICGLTYPKEGQAIMFAPLTKHTTPWEAAREALSEAENMFNEWAFGDHVMFVTDTEEWAKKHHVKLIDLGNEEKEETNGNNEM